MKKADEDGERSYEMTLFYNWSWIFYASTKSESDGVTCTVGASATWVVPITTWDPHWHVWGQQSWGLSQRETKSLFLRIVAVHVEWWLDVSCYDEVEPFDNAIDLAAPAASKIQNVSDPSDVSAKSYVLYIESDKYTI